MTRHDRWKWLTAVTYTLYAVLIALLLVDVEREATRPWRPDQRLLDRAWGWASSCTELVPHRPDVGPDDVVWRRVDRAFLDSLMSGHPISVWAWGHGTALDTIYVDPAYSDSLWVIAHELVHHRLGPTGASHPWVPFAFPCHLTSFQQRGSIMWGDR